MGCGNSTEDSTNREINRHYQIDARVEDEEKRLLLLGTGASGKSTIFKNLRKSKGEVIRDERTIEETTNTVRSNLVHYMLKLLIKAQQLYETDKEANIGCKIPEEDPKILEYTRQLMKNGQALADDMLSPETDTEQLGEAISYLWALPAIQETFKKKGGFSFPDNLEFFYDKCKLVMSKTFSPEEEDIIKARVRTTGIVHYSYTFEKSTYRITDVGGQRSERRKWIHQFEGVAAVIFVMALNHYNAVLFEDEKRNAMHEAVDLFVELANSRYFRNSELILFLNKKDLFMDELKKKPLGVCFTKEVGWNDEQWEGPDYIPSNDKQADEDYFTVCYEESIKFIQNVFVSRNEVETRIVFCHITMATDQKCVETVFWDVQNIVVRSNLKRGGLII